MLFVPIPFVITVVISILLYQSLRRLPGQKQRPLGQCWFIALLALYAVSSILIGLRWGYGLIDVLPVQSLLAALWGPLAWLSFRSLAKDDNRLTAADWCHAIPVASIMMLIAFSPRWIDVTLIGIYSVYAFLLIRLALAGPNALLQVRFSEAISSYRALQVTAVMMLCFVLVDVVISLDFRFFDGSKAGLVVALANVPALLLLSVAASLAGSGQTNEGVASDVNNAMKVEQNVVTKTLAGDDTAVVFSLVEEQMNVQCLYKEEQLNLNMLARKCGVPARQVSRAINQQTRKNVSQYVNSYRIKAACELLLGSDLSVTQVMLTVGYVTKSNFNREFLRITGVSPGQWRQAQSSTQ